MMRIESSTAEKLVLTLTAEHEDPTGGAVEFELTDTDTDTPPGSWVAGSWVAGSYVARTGRVQALTPTIGAAGALAVVEGNRYRVWARVGTVVLLVGTIEVR